MINLRWFDIIIVIMSSIKRIVHVGGRGWRRVTLMAARRIMTGRHNEREEKEKEKEKEKGRRARKMPGVVVVVVVVQGTSAQCDKTVRRLSPCGRARTLHRPRIACQAGRAARLLPPSRRLSNSNHQPRSSFLGRACGLYRVTVELIVHPMLA
jgi:hypothetical protein